jgi:hypothetical protein
MRRSHPLALAQGVLTITVLMATLVAGCGSQDTAGSGRRTDGVVTATTAPSSASAAGKRAGTHRMLSRMGTCQRLFGGPSPVMSDSLRWAMSAHAGRQVDPAPARNLARRLRGVAGMTRAPWRHEIRVAARMLPAMADAPATAREYRRYKRAHDRIVGDCTPYID